MDLQNKEIFDTLLKLSLKTDVFKSKIGCILLQSLQSEKEEEINQALRKVYQHYLQKHNFKIADLWHYFLMNAFFESRMPEHLAFGMGQPLPEELELSYQKDILVPLKKALTSLKFSVPQVSQTPLPYTEERKKLYHAFLTKDIKDIYQQAQAFFEKVTPGFISNYFYFEWNKKLKGIAQYSQKKLSDLVGYEDQKNLVVENTRRFLSDLEANNAFLFGSRGTGKTSLIRALLEEFKDQGLRIIKVYREDIEILPKIFDFLKKRKEKFIINLDDISYDEEEVIYKKHKVAIDSFFERKPKNVLLYATSNSQEIVKYFRQETTGNMVLDNRSEEEKKLEPPQKQVYDERRAFTERFGLNIFFGKMDEETALEVLSYYQNLYQISLPLEKLKKEFDTWVLYHGAVNGRTIENFIRYFYLI